MMGGVVAAFVALFLLVGTSAGHAVPARCDIGHGTAVETSVSHHQHQKLKHEQRNGECCTTTCGACLTMLPDIGVSPSRAFEEAAPLLAAGRSMTGQAPAPDLGPPRTSV